CCSVHVCAEVYTLSLHDALPIFNYKGTEASMSYYGRDDGDGKSFGSYYQYAEDYKDSFINVDQAYHPSGKKRKGDTKSQNGGYRSEEHTSELQSRFDLVCRLLLE